MAISISPAPIHDHGQRKVSGFVRVSHSHQHYPHPHHESLPSLPTTAIVPVNDDEVDELGEQLSLSSIDSDTSDEDDDLFDDDNTTSARASQVTTGTIASALKAATNRDAYGTWNHSLDFTLTLIGYVIGIHNFFRFPHMCYKWGTVTFLIPYAIFMIFLGFPAIFMECTVGQFYGVGSSNAFRQLAPIISGVSYILAWNSFVNCWIYGLILTWTRSYSGDSLSCLRGWMGCDAGHYFNTPNCYTATLDDCCAGVESVIDAELCPEWVERARTLNPDPYSLMYYNFQCVPMSHFCSLHNSTFIGDKKCRDHNGKAFSIYERRTHATSEYLYGFVLGMRKSFVSQSQKIMREMCRTKFGLARDSTDIRCSTEAVLKDDTYQNLVFNDTKYVTRFWSGKSTFMQVDPESSSFVQLPSQAMTTVGFITFFLFVDLLSVSYVTYVMSTLPFAILVYICILVMGLKGSTLGISDMLSLRGIESLWTSGDLWADALMQVIITSGVGNGALVSLASFNKYHHPYFFDVLLVTLLNVTTSLFATFACFCSIGHYVHDYGISISFESYIRPESAYSSVDFGFMVNSIFLTIIDGFDFVTLAAFFMLSSFPTDTTIRLVQNLLDTAAQALPRLRYHSAMALLATSFFFLVTLLPITRNGGIILFLEFEYCAHRFAMPIVTLLEVTSLAWVYKAERLVDDAEVLGVSYPLFRHYVIFSLKVFGPIVLIALLIYNAVVPSKPRLNTDINADDASLQQLAGWIFSFTPPILFTIALLKQLLSVPRSNWGELMQPLISWDKVRSMARNQRREKAKEKRKQEVLTNKVKQRFSISKDKLPKFKRKSKPKPSILPEGTKPENQDGDSRRVKIDDDLDKLSTNPKDEDIAEISSIASNFPRPSTTKPSQDAKQVKPEHEDKLSLGSNEIANWKKFIFWNEIIAHLEDWPDRLDESEVESEGSSVDTSDEESDHEKKVIPTHTHKNHAHTHTHIQTHQ